MDSAENLQNCILPRHFSDTKVVAMPWTRTCGFMLRVAPLQTLRQDVEKSYEGSVVPLYGVLHLVSVGLTGKQRNLGAVAAIGMCEVPHVSFMQMTLASVLCAGIGGFTHAGAVYCIGKITRTTCSFTDLQKYGDGEQLLLLQMQLSHQDGAVSPADTAPPHQAEDPGSHPKTLSTLEEYLAELAEV